jgi:hypothetical protein
MKKLMTLLSVCLLLGSQAYAKNILTFVINPEGDKDKSTFIYPEGTTYEVLNDAQKKQEPAEQSGKAKIFKGKGLILLVYPSYRPDKADRIPVKGDQLYAFEDAKAAQEFGYDIGWQEGFIKKNSHEQLQSRPYGMEKRYRETTLERKVVFQSEQRPGQYNLKMYFRNGLEFHYLDGKATASLDGNPQIVEGKYIVHTDLGTAKISFNPETGKTYWVFLKEEQSN